MPKATYRSAEGICFGAIIARLRRQRGWTLRKLAQRAGMNPTYLGVLEKGGNVPTLTTLIELAEVLGVEAVDIVREVERARRPPTTVVLPPA